ncbi:hypothetical protein Pan54_01310 [Rubinisphaera italica]|uniref:Tetratricopeptide repeat protein n=1 Tax=Rubinisphaera italica TaxID=2527969 RepID=A0A5C5XB65_9PLAN|nr:hypothetical protein Pan54_01310 [Rubinisphaera italica]
MVIIERTENTVSQFAFLLEKFSLAAQNLCFPLLQSSVPVTFFQDEIDPLQNLQASPNRELWKQYFSTKREGTQVRRMIQKLQRDKHFDHITVALEEALRAGQPEPWMYEVLALSMQIEGRPEQEVERILLSMTDFNVRDVPNLLGSAAYLVRLGAHKQALKMYRQVSRLEPTRPEPYLLGLKLADKTQDIESLTWAASGILTYFWYDGFQKQHDLAIKLLSDWKLRLENEGRAEEANRMTETLQQALIRDLQLKLTWSGDADLDLIIQEPLGTECSFAQPHTASGGSLLHEGAGPNQAECYEDYVCAFAAPGDYVVTVRHNSGRIVGNRARLTVTRYAGTDHENTEMVNVVFDKAEKKFRISLHQGRRTQQAPVFEPIKQTIKQKKQETAFTLHDLRNQYRKPHSYVLPQLQQNNNFGAVGFSPVVAPVNSGVQLNATAVVSPDRRYVRLGMQPVFTDITDVFTFSFAGGGQ